jgi:hypothetical protein
MTEIQNILNGESIAGTFEKASLSGSYFAWREDLTTGATPAPGALSESWIEFRANELAREFEIEDREAVEERLKRQEEVLESSLKSKEVLLWFENDYFCQMNQTYLLSWYGRHSRSLPRISILDLKEDIFLGELEPADFAKLHTDHVSVSQETMALATRAWDAISSPDPLSQVAMLGSDTSALPQLHRTLKSNLARFPSINNGLGRIENLVLEIAASGKRRFKDLFPVFFSRLREYGYGDAHVWNSIRRLASARVPFLTISLPENKSKTPWFLEAEVIPTTAGLDALAGRADYVALNGIDQWIGGVHLQNGGGWRWDDRLQSLVT